MNPRPRRRRGITHVEFKSFVATWADRLKVQPRRVQVQIMTRKWASCSTAGTLTFATDLLTESPAFREYVVVHELLHLMVPNHGRVFRSLLRTYLPAWEDAVRERRPRVCATPQSEV